MNFSVPSFSLHIIYNPYFPCSFGIYGPSILKAMTVCNYNISVDLQNINKKWKTTFIINKDYHTIS